VQILLQRGSLHTQLQKIGHIKKCVGEKLGLGMCDASRSCGSCGSDAPHSCKQMMPCPVVVWRVSLKQLGVARFA